LLGSMSLARLKQIAKESFVVNYSRLSKEELIRAIETRRAQDVKK
jgi:hypothetical protein